MDLQIFQEGSFLLFFMPLFLGIHGVQGRGSYYFSKRGATKRVYKEGGALLWIHPPFFLPGFPRFTK
jgi:hypothetical protein